MTTAEKFIIKNPMGAKYVKDVLSIFRDCDYKTISDTLKSVNQIAVKHAKLNFNRAVIDVDEILKKAK